MCVGRDGASECCEGGCGGCAGPGLRVHGEPEVRVEGWCVCGGGDDERIQYKARRDAHEML